MLTARPRVLATRRARRRHERSRARIATPRVSGALFASSPAILVLRGREGVLDGGMTGRGGARAPSQGSFHDVRRFRAAAKPAQRPYQAARTRSVRGDAQGRRADRAGARSPGRTGAAGRHDGRARQIHLRIRQGSRRLSRAAQLSRLSQVDLHLDQSRRLPRHPGREAAARRRHRQYRRHADRRGLARRRQPHVRGGRSAAARADGSST